MGRRKKKLKLGDSAFSNVKVSTVPPLKNLHDLLVKVSPFEFLNQDGHGVGKPMISFADIIDLSNLVFEELHKQSEQLLSGTSNISRVAALDENGRLTSDSKLSQDDFLLLLRCSMILMRFLELDLMLVLERCRILVAVLGKLCPIFSPLQFTNESACHVDAITPEGGISSSFSSSILEVFLDELLMHDELLKHFIMTTCASATAKKLFLSHCYGDIQAIMELVSSHFLLSVQSESTFDSFIMSLSWSYDVDNHVPIIGLASVLVLMGYPVISSAPVLLQAHLILLASRCIGIHVPADTKNLDTLDMNLYILAFELSIKLYLGFMPFPNFFDNTRDESESSVYIKGQLFCSFIQPSTNSKLKQQIDMFIDFWNLPLHQLYSESKVDMLSKAISYIKGNQDFIDEMFRDEACTILTCVVESILPGESEWSHEGGEMIQQEICYIAAALKLMSSSALQIVWFLKQNGYAGAMDNTSKENLHCKEYDFISRIIRCFGNCGVDPHIEKILSFLVEITTGAGKESMKMFLHLASLLSYSFSKKIDFLWKGCIFMLIPLMNLIILEEGNLDAFRPLICNKKGPTSQAEILKDSSHKSSSIAIASKLKKVRDQIKHLRHENNRLGSGEITEMADPMYESNASKELKTDGVQKHATLNDEANTCTGEIFLECLTPYHKNNSNVEDLVDFIECKNGKDYSSWLENRARFRKWKYKRVSSIKHQDKRNKRVGFMSCRRI
ncbi:uncharacterized protein A4U43_C08F32250 [Asparagus officinalis]|uniref:uncharacterized protein LOC109822221 n=1 Tax=Asparagus officinalis TaxID=4686 RepID=UPI00098E3633|nr:uncharacterized protein LOC109822221 [Asparagus officinalis]ONK61659.1 uncharacterized protein A4U43_C08F32250 [Asparagus officinalis]